MRIATIADRATVVNIIVAMFKHNPTIQFMVKNDNKTNKRITAGNSTYPKGGLSSSQKYRIRTDNFAVTLLPFC